MADVKISELPALTSPDGAEELVVNDGGTTKKITIANATSASLAKAGGTMTGSLNITQASTADAIKLTRTSTSNNNMLKFVTGGSGKWIVGQRNDSTDHFRFYSYGTGSDVLSIQTDGRVGVGNSSPDGTLHVHTASAGTVTASTQADDLVIENSAEGGMTIITPDNQSARIRFTSPATDGTDTGGGELFYRHNIAKVRLASTKANGVLSLSTGTGGVDRLLIDSAGQITMPSQPAFQVYPSVAQNNIPILSWTTVAFGAESYDVGGNFAGNTFTAPISGKYQLNLFIRLGNVDITPSYYQLRIVTSNKTYYYTFSPRFSSDPSIWTPSFSVLAHMDASDTAYFQIYQGGGAAQTDIHYETTFSGYLAC
mgnify:CR=1 FL=1